MLLEKLHRKITTKTTNKTVTIARRDEKASDLRDGRRDRGKAIKITKNIITKYRSARNV